MIIPSSYEYLWTDYEVNYLFASCYLFKEFRKSDMVLIYNHKDKGLMFFLSKKERKKLSNFGVKFFTEMFPAWKILTLKNIEHGERLIEQTNSEIKEIPSMSISKIRDRIIARANLFKSLGENYFYTEFFFLDMSETLMPRYGL